MAAGLALIVIAALVLRRGGALDAIAVIGFAAILVGGVVFGLSARRQDG